MSSKKSIFLILILLLASTAAHAGVILDCDFEDQPLDQLLGTGGAEAGQPVSLGGVNAYVRTDPGGDRAVEITDPINYGPFWSHQDAGWENQRPIPTLLTSGVQDELTPWRPATALAAACSTWRARSAMTATSIG